MNTARSDQRGGGTNTSGLVMGGHEPGGNNKTEEWSKPTDIQDVTSS